MAIKAVTFDFWNTLIRVGADRHERDERRAEQFANVFASHSQQVEAEVIAGALGHVQDLFDERWEANEQFRMADAIEEMLLVLDVPNKGGLSEDLAAKWIAAGKKAPVEPVEDAELVRGVLTSLAEDFQLGIICDVAMMPSRVLRGHLERFGMESFFSHMAFSDEIGVYKPDAAIFRAAQVGLDIDDPEEIVHVGDLRRTDVAGARQAGCVSVRYRAVSDDAPPTEVGGSADADADDADPDSRRDADYVIDTLTELPMVLDGID